MSVRIISDKCKKCGSCLTVCPGNLIKRDEQGRAYIKRPKDCWGCTSCLKECKFGAIYFFLGEDIGGKGSSLGYEEQDDTVIWTITKSTGEKSEVVLNKKDSNKY